MEGKRLTKAQVDEAFREIRERLLAGNCFWDGEGPNPLHRLAGHLAALEAVPEDVAREADAVKSALETEGYTSGDDTMRHLSILATAAARVPGLEKRYREDLARHLVEEVVLEGRIEDLLEAGIRRAERAESERDAALKARDEKLTLQAAQRDSALREVDALRERVATLEAERRQLMEQVGAAMREAQSCMAERNAATAELEAEQAGRLDFRKRFGALGSETFGAFVERLASERDAARQEAETIQLHLDQRTEAARDIAKQRDTLTAQVAELERERDDLTADAVRGAKKYGEQVARAESAERRVAELERKAEWAKSTALAATATAKTATEDMQRAWTRQAIDATHPAPGGLLEAVGPFLPLLRDMAAPSLHDDSPALLSTGSVQDATIGQVRVLCAAYDAAKGGEALEAHGRKYREACERLERFPAWVGAAMPGPALNAELRAARWVLTGLDTPPSGPGGDKREDCTACDGEGHAPSNEDETLPPCSE